MWLKSQKKPSLLLLILDEISLELPKAKSQTLNGPKWEFLKISTDYPFQMCWFLEIYRKSNLTKRV